MVPKLSASKKAEMRSGDHFRNSSLRVLGLFLKLLGDLGPSPLATTELVEV